MQPAVACGHDYETYSVVDLKKAGVDVYAEHPETGIHWLSYKFPDGRRGRWCPGRPDPASLLDHVARGGTLTGWNTAFEAGIWRWVIRRICPHWPQPRLEQFDDTMARALVRSLPGSLDECAVALKSPIQKDKVGHKLMMKLCRPTAAWSKWDKGGRVGPEPKKWHDDPAELEREGQYCDTDVDAEMWIGERLPPLTPDERANWLLNETVNRRGIRLDLPCIGPARAIAEAETSRLDREISTVTEGAVSRVTKAKDLLDWLSDELHPLPNLRKRTIEVALAQKIERPHVRRALEIRREGSKASVKKLNAMMACVNSDGRARGLLGYHTATTGRAASRRVQVQNMVRAWLKAHEINDVLALLLTDAHLDAIADAIRYGYGDPIAVISSCLRALIIPTPGRMLIGGDYANIEGRVVAWLAGELWKLKAFEDYDKGIGHDLYLLAYARSFGVDVATLKKSDPRRQVGKVQELSLGFGGGPFALLNMCLQYGMNVAELADAVHAITDPYVWADTLEQAPMGSDLRGLTPHVWTGLRVVVDAWREAHPFVKAFWYELEQCAINATLLPGQKFSINSKLVTWCSNGHFLFAQLPSGRLLAYANPHVRWFRRSDGREMPAGFIPSLKEMRQSPKPYRRSLKYYGTGKKSKKWEARKAWHGLLAENVVQATARDVLFCGMRRAEAAGYPIVLHVHDEMVAEVPYHDPMAPPYRAADFHNIMCTPEPGMRGLPVAAKADAMHRYGKE
jgi:DNA polymerase